LLAQTLDTILPQLCQMALSGAANGNSSSSDNKLSTDCFSRPGLDSEWSYKAQFRAITACSAPDDFTFQEGSVKDVTDKARARAAAVIQKSLVEACKRKAKRKHSSSDMGRLLPLRDLDEIPEPELVQEVKSLRKDLQRLREGGAYGGQLDESAAGALVQLERLPVTVRCLKATKVAAELNQPCWRSNDVSPDVREHAASLVRRWRAMYREEETGRPDGLSEEAHERSCKNVAMDIETNVYQLKQRVAQHGGLVQSICALLMVEPEVAKSMVRGGTPTKDFVSRAARKLTPSHGFRK